MWWTGKEQVTLAMLGVIALSGLGALRWQRQSPPPLVLERTAISPVESANTATSQTVAEPVAASTSAHPVTSWDRALNEARRVDVNTASAAELERLPKVGPAMAQRIVAYRRQHGPFLTTDDLLRVRGIGVATYRAFRDDVTVDE